MPSNAIEYISADFLHNVLNNNVGVLNVAVCILELAHKSNQKFFQLKLLLLLLNELQEEYAVKNLLTYSFAVVG